MKSYILKTYTLAALAFITLNSCSNDDDSGSDSEEENEMEIDFSGTFVQKDQMGRPGINTVLSGTDFFKDNFNRTIPSEQTADFRILFEDRVLALHDAFGTTYENNILNQDVVALTTVLAADVLQVAPDETTTYYDGTNLLTGRNLKDDVIDISLILIFGGENGNRFDGQDTNDDGMQDLPILVSDGVDASGETPSNSFPYLESPHGV